MTTKTRRLVVGAFAIGLIACAYAASSSLRRQEAVQVASIVESLPIAKLTHLPEIARESDETTLRAIVSEHELRTAQWAPDGGSPYRPGKSFRVLVLPKEVGEIYGRRPLWTLQLLKQIAESGPSADARSAIAYAHAAVGYATNDTIELLCACSYAYAPEQSDFTYEDRVAAFEQIERLISNLQKSPMKMMLKGKA